MKKKITVFCSLIVALSVCLTMVGVTGFQAKNDVTTANIQNYYASNDEETTADALGDIIGSIGGDSLGGIGDLFGSVDTGALGDAIGGFGDTLGGVGDALGGLVGGLGDAIGGVLGGGFGGSGSGVNTTAPVSTTSADLGLIIPVPAATQTPTEIVTVPVVSETEESGETVDYAATSNPYTKPSATFVAGDEDETIKWLQWIFIYTDFGLKDNGITGVLDEDTVAVIKKLQHKNKLTVDGNVTEEVIKAAEALYYQSMLGEDVSAIEIPSDATTGENVSNQGAATDNENGIPVALLIIVLVIIWVLAIGGIVLLFVFKKKKMNAEKKAETEKEENKEPDNKPIEISSLSDLFEEAEKKDK